MKSLRNIAIIAHVDHGKTTLVDSILREVGFFSGRNDEQDCFLDSNDLERERGITILSKNISISYKGFKINVIDTPGHSDFGGQVERVLRLADGVLLLVDAAEGPMPQTRFVLDKALKLGLKPLVIINKVDKPDARPGVVHNKVFDLFAELDATDDQLDFHLMYGSGKNGWVDEGLDGPRKSVVPLLDAIIKHIPPPETRQGHVQMQIATLDYSEFVGRIGIGRVYRGSLDISTPLCHIQNDGTSVQIRIKQLFTFQGLDRKETASVACGDICAVVGIEGIDIGDTLSDMRSPEPLPPIKLDEPTISMVFSVNNSPLYGKEGTYVSSRHLRERLFKETERDVALQVKEMGGDAFNVMGRGVLHISILLENMRREGYEVSVAQPQVIRKVIDGVTHEPMEVLDVDVPAESAGKVIEIVGSRRGEMRRMDSHGGRQNLEFIIPTRGIIGIRSKIMTASAGEAIVSHIFDHYAPARGEISQRSNGVLVSMGEGVATAYAIDYLQQRGIFFIPPNSKVYEGMIVAEHCKEGDLTVNLQRSKQLTNVRASGTDKAMKIAPHRRMSLEETLEYIAADELVEVTPKNIRMRKRHLSELERKRNR